MHTPDHDLSCIAQRTSTRAAFSFATFPTWSSTQTILLQTAIVLGFAAAAGFGSGPCNIFATVGEEGIAPLEKAFDHDGAKCIWFHVCHSMHVQMPIGSWSACPHKILLQSNAPSKRHAYALLF